MSNGFSGRSSGTCLENAPAAGVRAHAVRKTIRAAVSGSAPLQAGVEPITKLSGIVGSENRTSNSVGYRTADAAVALVDEITS